MNWKFAELIVFQCYRAHSVGDINSDARLLIVRIPKNDLDDAHKDKQDKIFSSDFKVGEIVYDARCIGVGYLIFFSLNRT